MNFVYQFLIACIPAVISGLVTYFKTSSDNKLKLKELDQKLTEQSIKHKHELERMQKDHEHQIDLIKTSSQTSQEENLQNAVTGMAVGAFGTVLENMLGEVKTMDDLEKLTNSTNTQNPN
ncbi:hypothetical protein [Lactococcus formosensis]|uniref:hypothetical protein n=1 Tax=Lactococcus formosensis TaxID=1281486 RepID=UPI00254B12AB|nr:hypothetical protein [Lactococcus formosensis]